MPSLTMSNSVFFTPSSSKPHEPSPRSILLARDVEVLGAVLELADVADLDEARAGVVGLVAHDAVELGRVRDDLVHRQHHVRRREDQVLDAARRAAWPCSISTASVATRSAACEQVRFLGDLQAGGTGRARVGARARDAVDRGRHVQRRRGRDDLLLDERALGRREVLPVVAELDRRRDAGHALHLAGLVDDGLRPGLLVGLPTPWSGPSPSAS